LAEPVELVLLRLGVKDPVVEVGVERRDARLGARRADAAVADRPVGSSEFADGRRMDVDAEPAGTTTFLPSTRMSRCEWTCRNTNSCVSGARPALRVSSIGFGDADQTGTTLSVTAGEIGRSAY
jgi:hypothetical protein